MNSILIFARSEKYTVVTHGRVNSSSMWSIVDQRHVTNVYVRPLEADEDSRVQRTRTLFSRKEDEKTIYREKVTVKPAYLHWPKRVTLLTGRRLPHLHSEARIYRLWKETRIFPTNIRRDRFESRNRFSPLGGSGESQFLEVLDETAGNRVETFEREKGARSSDQSEGTDFRLKSDSSSEARFELTPIFPLIFCG